MPDPLHLYGTVTDSRGFLHRTYEVPVTVFSVTCPICGETQTSWPSERTPQDFENRLGQPYQGAPSWFAYHAHSD